jgi:cysteine desulfurase / selenocysteine lyase
MNIEDIRKDFPLLKRVEKGKKIIYLDNAATSLKPQSVISAVTHYYEKECANVHRGLHLLSEEASIKYEESHEKVAKFIGAKKEECVLTKSTTEGINLVMYSLLNSDFFKKGDKIVVSGMEHHSNIVPWQFLERKVGVELEYVKLQDNFEIDMGDLEEKVKGAKFVSFSGASNTVATIPDLRKIEKLVHKQDALFCIDGAQLIPHHEVNFKSLNADFLAFSGHKMLAPTGTGGLIAKREHLEKFEPFLFGGDMIMEVKEHSSTWNDLPYKFEAGTPNIAGSYGLREAIDYIKKVGYKTIDRQEKLLTKICIEEMESIDSIKMYCPKDTNKQGGIVMFESTKLAAHELAMTLSEMENICIRSGMHCAEPLVSTLNKDGLARASFYMYNTEEEVYAFIKALKETIKLLG